MSSVVVGVMGGGRWGLALAAAAHRAGNSVVLCTRREVEGLPSEVLRTQDVAVLGRHAQLILLAVPSDVARPAARSLGDGVDGRHLVVHATRGLSHEGLLPLSELVRQETPVRRVGALGGPALADDLLEGRPSVMVAASRYPEVLRAVQTALVSSALRLSVTHDLVGLEWSSALVGALLVGLGYARTVGIRPGLLSGTMTRGMGEAAKLGVAAGAEERTFAGLAGFGDLMAAMDPSGARPEVRFGEALAQGQTVAQARVTVGLRVEAVELVPRVLAFAHEKGIAVPILEALGALLRGEANVESLLPALMQRKQD